MNSTVTPHTTWQQDIQYLGGSAAEEEKRIRHFANDIRKVVRQAAEDRDGAPIRPQHAKQLAGIKRAEFRVAPDIAVDLQAGFLQPGRVYPAFVRFSNAAGQIRPSDAVGDLRGLAIRVLPDTGDAHDWLMTNAEEHHARDATEAMAVTTAFAGSSLITKALKRLFDERDDWPGLVRKMAVTADKMAGLRRLFAKLGPDAAAIVRILSRQTKQSVPSLATETFWSRAPIAIGPVAGKYLVRPQLPKEPGDTPESLHHELAQRLRRGPVAFDFCLQRYQSAETTPLENARPAWKTAPEKIGELVLPAQDLNDATAQEASRMINSLNFSPWQLNSPAFVPLGNMNRARKLVYLASARERKTNS